MLLLTPGFLGCGWSHFLVQQTSWIGSFLPKEHCALLIFLFWKCPISTEFMTLHSWYNQNVLVSVKSFCWAPLWGCNNGGCLLNKANASSSSSYRTVCGCFQISFQSFFRLKLLKPFSQDWNVGGWFLTPTDLHHALAHSTTCIRLAHATFPPHCHLFCHGELSSAVSAVSIVFCRWSVSPTGGDGCLMRNDRPKNSNGQLRFWFTGGLIGAQPQFVLLLTEKHHRGKNKCVPVSWGGQTWHTGVSPLSKCTF